VTSICNHGGYCLRRLGHKGAHTAAPAACTLDWDDHYQERRNEREREAKVLMDLDFPTPPWADLLDS